MSQPGDQDDRSRSRTVLLATDSSQSVIGEIVDGRTQTIAYSAYGEQSAQQKVETRLGFNGQLREANIGWYLLGNGYRAYNPRLMRFHSPDSWSPFGEGGLNAYMYCGGEPVMNTDSSGHLPFPVLSKAFANLMDVKNIFVNTYRANVAVSNNPVTALVSSIKGLGLSNTADFLPTNGTLTFGTRPMSNPVLTTAKVGGLHHKVGGVPSSTPNQGTSASLPGSSDGGQRGGFNSDPGRSWTPIPPTRRPPDKETITIWTRYPDEVKRSLSPESQKRVRDIRDRKEPL